jgi:hypothetical protein
MRRLRVLTWHVHGNYLLYLSQADVDFFLPTRSDGAPGYGGRGTTLPFGPNVHDVPAEAVRSVEFDCVLFQCRQNVEIDQFEILTPAQRRLPHIYLEHDTPPGAPTVARHWFDDSGGLLVHVTPFNALMWDSGRTPTRVIDHGVFVPESVRYTGDLERGLVVVNNLRERGRRLGADQRPHADQAILPPPPGPYQLLVSAQVGHQRRRRRGAGDRRATRVKTRSYSPGRSHILRVVQ